MKQPLKEPLKVTPPKGYVCRRAAVPPVIDGRLDDPAWKAARWTSDFVDITNRPDLKPRFRTRAKMLWDDDYFYVAAELEEPHVWATLTEHDSVIFHDNDFEVFIDPDGDNHQYYEFEINALNTGWDLRLVKPYRDGGPALNEWEIPGLKTAVHVHGTLNDPRDKDRGWTVEVAFPWRALGEFANRSAPPSDGDQWRVNFSRVEWQVEVREGKYRKPEGKPEDNWVWSPQHVVDMHRPERWGYVQFSGEPAGEGTTRFRRDSAEPARELLHRVYYAQKAYQEKNGRWAASLDALGIAGAVTLRLTEGGWEAAATVRASGARALEWRIREDSKVWAVRNGKAP